MSAYFESLNKRRTNLPVPVTTVPAKAEPAPMSARIASTPVVVAPQPIVLPLRPPRPILSSPTSAYAMLRERLLAAGNGKPLKSLVFAGCEGTEGCTQVVRDFAELLATSGLNVLLVDADLRTAGLTIRTGAVGSNLRELASTGDLPPAQIVGRGKLTIVPSPAAEAEKEHFFGAPEFTSWLDAQRRRFDYVLLDAPPLLKFADGTLLGRLADGVVIIVRAEVTPRDSLARVREQLDRAGVRVIGAVLNRAREVVPAPLRKFLANE